MAKGKPFGKSRTDKEVNPASEAAKGKKGQKPTFKKGQKPDFSKFKK